MTSVPLPLQQPFSSSFFHSSGCPCRNCACACYAAVTLRTLPWPKHDFCSSIVSNILSMIAGEIQLFLTVSLHSSICMSSKYRISQTPVPK
uniref:Uncharacterized protein n=1 Tax=Arundo donax TaxID=35708 RepID=A0A0A8Z8I3_ARUDO